jgi:predicted MPP superfamily phosphohydrolase
VLGALFRLGLLGIHTYVWWRLVYQARLPRRWFVTVTLLLIALYLSGVITTASRLVWPRVSATLGWISLPWMALCAMVFVALVILDVFSRIARGARRVAGGSTAPVSTERRAFLSRITGTAAVAIGSTSVAHGMIRARGKHEIVDVEVKLATLPRELDGFTIVQLTDLHVGMTIDRAFVQQVVDRTNALAPDLVVLTGDLVDGPVEDLHDEIAPLRELRAKHGLYAVTGNHEYFSGADAWIEELTRLGITFLRNAHVTVAGGFTLAGVDDYSGDRFPGHGADYRRALYGRDPALPVVLLAHQPRQVRSAAEHGVDLQLSGHTHGGQIWPWHYLVRAQQGGLLAGRYEWRGTQLYVSRGCGYWGPPVRLLAPLEITRVILRTG